MALFERFIPPGRLMPRNEDPATSATPATLLETVATVATVAGGNLSNSQDPDDWTDDHAERAAIVEFDGVSPRKWAEGFTRLDPGHPPADVPPKRWLRFIDDCGMFLDGGWAAKAAALGWGPLDLFGCNRDRPFARIDHMGLLWLLNGRKLVAITADSAAIRTPSGGTLTFRRKPTDLGAVVAWEAAT